MLFLLFSNSIIAEAQKCVVFEIFLTCKYCEYRPNKIKEMNY